uniref:Serpentine receptor class gamma n=1 Tax=Strongyloides venezuelensis TaxID=75913 RepID=A0A0K0G634_STRVS
MAEVNLILEIIQLIYLIPSTLLMILSVNVIIKEIKNKNVNFNTQFYIIIACKLINEIFYIITIFIFARFPKWGFYNDYLKNNNWTATIFYVLVSQQTTFMFLITLLISINRYIAVKYPLSYKHHFSRSKIVIILVCFIILSTMIGLGNIFFNARYKKSGLYDFFAPYLESKNVVYYRIFCQIFIYGTISIVTCIFNVISELRKALKIAFGCSKKFSEKVNTKVTYRRRLEP